MSLYKNYINGELTDNTENEFEVYSPFDGHLIAKIPLCGIADARIAINGAEKSFREGYWKNLGIQGRINCLSKIFVLLEDNLEKIAEIEAENIGVLKKYSMDNIRDSLKIFKNYLDLAMSFEFDTFEKTDYEENVLSQVKREPFGVCSLIIPWNYPFNIAVNKLIPALISGNSVVMKPSPLAPLSCLYLGELFHKIDFPRGVVNIFCGNIEASEEITCNPSVSLISFTGSTETAKIIYRNSSVNNFKKLILECGGNSSHIVLDYKESDRIVLSIMVGFMIHAGQYCIAGRRLLIHSSCYDEFLKKLLVKIRFVKYMENMNEETTFFPIEPVISSGQIDKINLQVREALDEGAVLLAGGKKAKIKGQGYFYEPTVISGVKKGMKINLQEIFGPVICIYRFDEIEEAIEISNESPYGLNSVIWSENEKAIEKILGGLEIQSTYINTTPFDSHNNNAPFGGIKSSGLGVENGKYGISEFLRYKHIMSCPKNTD
jgi:aldehyde dehydrogenase (NAD+)